MNRAVRLLPRARTTAHSRPSSTPWAFPHGGIKNSSTTSSPPSQEISQAEESRMLVRASLVNEEQMSPIVLEASPLPEQPQDAQLPSSAPPADSVVISRRSVHVIILVSCLVSIGLSVGLDVALTRNKGKSSDGQYRPPPRQQNQRPPPTPKGDGRGK